MRWKVETANVRLRPGSLDRSQWLRRYRERRHGASPFVLKTSSSIEIGITVGNPIVNGKAGGGDF